MSRPVPVLLFFAVLLFAGASQAAAEHSTPRARTALVAEQATVTPGGPLRLALTQRLAPGWHVYWSNPGDAGGAPELAVTGAAAEALQFAPPRRIPFGPLVNYGYTDRATFVLPVGLPADLRPGERAPLLVEASWLICERICVPESATFRLDLPVAATAGADGATAPVFALFDAEAPRPAPFAARIGFSGTTGALLLTAPELGPDRVRAAEFFPATGGVLDHAAAQSLDVREGSVRLGLTRGAAPLPERVDGLLVLTDAAGARSAWTVGAVPGPVPGGTGTGVWRALGLALLGGLLLNLMPCVFPVLAMKAIGLAKLAGAQRGAVRAEALAYTAGVLATALALGGAVIAARAGGGALGWGFQLTSPAFVAALAWLMLAMGLNLSGVFTVDGPSGAGQGWAARGGLGGAFATGVLAVLVATPCTAPFMAVALGAALTLPAGEALAVFAALGAGLAAPTLVLAVAPGLAARLPRPGMWMETLRGLLAFPLYATAAWLLWVLAQAGGSDAVGAALAGAVLIGFAAWAVGAGQRRRRSTDTPARRIAWAAAAVAALLALALLPRLEAASPPAATESAGAAWSAERVAALRAEGRPVFVNLTAAWCLTCKVNERLVLADPAVRAAFGARGVTVLTGDWTRGDPAIGALLRAEGRDGVPLYLYYAPGAAAPELLPPLLTPGLVLRAIGAA